MNISIPHSGHEFTIQLKKAFRSKGNAEFMQLFDKLLLCSVQAVIIASPKDKLFDIFGELHLLKLIQVLIIKSFRICITIAMKT